MTPEELQQCLEEAFGSVEPPCLEELAAADTYMDESFKDAVKTDTARAKRWQELRPMTQYIGDYSEICLLAPKAYQYYLPAYLHALIVRQATNSTRKKYSKLTINTPNNAKPLSRSNAAYRPDS